MIEDRHRKLVYSGKKSYPHAAGCQYVRIRHSNGNTTGLKHVCKHSPTGMNWGYGGSGPADCALSILTDFCKRAKLGVRIANENYQEFKFVFVATFPDSFQLAGEQIENWLKKKKIIE